MAHENATPRPWRTTKTQPNVICNEGGNHWIARATIGKGSPRFIQDAGIAAANAVLIVEAVNAYDTLRAENERLKRERDVGFNHGYLMAVANIINLHRETVVAADVLLQIDLTIEDAEAFELAEYDMEALERLRSEPRAADFFKRQPRAALSEAQP